MISTVLNNGLRIVAEHFSGPVSYIGFAVNAGSRDDGHDNPGLAHFLEHTIFKGTLRRRAWHISNRMESVGGELNAYTTKELTMVYTVAPTGYTERALELLADLVKNASFPAAETEREREIIIEEIHSYSDSPAEAVFDEFDELLYAGSDMAHNILGSVDSVRKLNGTMARQFLERFYTPENMVLYCCDRNPEKAIRIIEKYFSGLHFPNPRFNRTSPEIRPCFSETRDHGNTQANTMLGCRIPGRNHPLRPALMLFNNILGGPALNSKLAQEVRERRGLVYTIESNVITFSDCGSFTVYFGSDPATVNRCVNIVRQQIDRLAQAPLTPHTFARVRDQYCGQLSILADNRESFAMSLGRSLLLYGEIRNLEHTIEAIRNLDSEQLLEAARLVAANSLSRLTLR